MRVLILLVSLIGTCATGCAESVLLYPSTNAIDAGVAKRIEIDAGDGRVIEAFVARSFDDLAEPEAYVLEFPGNATRAEQIATYAAQRWKPHRIEAWSINYPGFGGSTGPTKLSGIAPMALRAYDELARHADGKPIFCCSNSFGGTAALHVASKRPVAGLIMQNPPPLRELVMSPTYGWWNLWLGTSVIALQIPDELEAPKTAREVTVPAIFITALADDLVPPQYQQKIIDQYAGPVGHLKLVGRGHHDSIQSPEEWEGFRKALDWLWSACRLQPARVERSERAG